MRHFPTALLILLIAFGSWTCHAQGPDGWLKECQRIVGFLAADSLQGRDAGSMGEKEAAAFISREFQRDTRLNPGLQSFSFIHPSSQAEKASQNVYAFLNNHADHTIMIGAHYDHLGMGGPRSLDFNKKGIHNGADDNASGVAMLLMLLKSNRKWASKSFNYMFVSFGAHEVGLFGSQAFAQHWKRSWRTPYKFINLDMVGRLNELNFVKVLGAETDTTLQAFLQKHPFKWKWEKNAELENGDCRTFYAAGVECLQFTTGMHDDYHRMSDDIESLNFNGMYQVQMMLEDLLRSWQKPPTGTAPLPFKAP